MKQTQLSGVARGSRFDSLLFGSLRKYSVKSVVFSLEITTLKVIAASVTIRLKKIIYMSNIWLAIVRTTNSIVKFDSSAECPGWKIFLATGLNDLPYLSLVWMFCGITHCVKGCSSGLSVSLGNTFKNRFWQIHTSKLKPVFTIKKRNSYRKWINQPELSGCRCHLKKWNVTAGLGGSRFHY